ncbi:MAG TPA: type II toxin-antitoxin system RelE/ParE family toxin, partial [Nitrososphaera sp.]|nr:type II toxin-antitoxin system RelE/ParE family toxin [Nitrososphaera sp.]
SFKKLQKLDHTVKARIIEKLDEAASDPFLVAKRLAGLNLYSIRAGDYRVIVSIEKNKMIVFVIDLGHRSKIYKKL